LNLDRVMSAKIGWLPYLAFSCLAFFSQHLAAWLALSANHPDLSVQACVVRLAHGGRWPIPWWFWLSPMRALMPNNSDPFGAFTASSLPLWIYLTNLAVFLAAMAILVWLSFRRAVTLGRSEGVAALAITPVTQVPVILWFSIAPRRKADPLATEPSAGPSNSRLTAAGFLAGAALCVLLEAFCTLVLRTYGFGVFVATPFMIGLATAYLANRGHRLGIWATMGVVFGALCLGAIALIGFAFEGFICLVLAFPLIGFEGVIGAFLGRALALRGARTRGSTAFSIAILPLVMVAEVLFPPKLSFSSLESVKVAAPPSAVWDAVIHMGPIPGAPAAPFRWGLAYPMRGEIIGTGVGSLRRGVFSTGVAYERVTEWSPGKRLSFVVLSDPPTMTELSPWAHVNAPHVNGYFKTLDAVFTITPLADGGSQLSLTTRHELDIEPVLYWTPIVEWAIHANKVRVLDHFRDQAEASQRPARATP
jgi:hypothetical protein